MAPKMLRYVIRGMAIAAAFAGVTAFAATPKLTALVGLGKGLSAAGVTASTDTACHTLCGSNNCSCFEISGSGTLTGIGATSFSTNFAVDSEPDDPIHNLDPDAVAFGCLESFGILTLTPQAKKFAGNLLLNYHGMSCINTTGNNLALSFNGNYLIDSKNSTGKFAGAAGSGLIAGSGEQTTGIVFGNVNGTLFH